MRANIIPGNWFLFPRHNYINGVGLCYPSWNMRAEKCLPTVTITEKATAWFGDDAHVSARVIFHQDSRHMLRNLTWGALYLQWVTTYFKTTKNVQPYICMNNARAYEGYTQNKYTPIIVLAFGRYSCHSENMEAKNTVQCPYMAALVSYGTGATRPTLFRLLGAHGGRSYTVDKTKPKFSCCGGYLNSSKRVKGCIYTNIHIAGMQLWRGTIYTNRTKTIDINSKSMDRHRFSRAA